MLSPATSYLDTAGVLTLVVHSRIVHDLHLAFATCVWVALVALVAFSLVTWQLHCSLFYIVQGKS